MKIAIIGSRGYPSNYGGYESFIKELSERLVKKGVNVTVYCHKSLFSERPSQLNGINLVYLPSIETKLLSQLTHSFLSMVHACFSLYDVLFVVNSANGPLGIIPRILGKKTVINVDGIEWLRPKWKGLGARYFYLAARLATKLYDVIVSDAEEMRKVYLEQFGRDSKVIAYGAPRNHIGKVGDLSKWGLERSGYYLIVGRLIPDNNSKLIAEGFLKSSSIKKLVIVGGVPYKDGYVERIKDLARTDDRLIVTGHIDNRDDIAELFQNSYMYIHGHEFGGTNPTMIEALGYGCAILALDTKFNHEMLQNGRYGDFFEKDINDIVHKIDFWDKHTNEIEDLRRKSRDGITEKYQWDFVTEQYYNLFKEIVADSK